MDRPGSLPELKLSEAGAPARPGYSGEFTTEQKEYLAGFLSGIAQAGWTTFVGHNAAGQLTADPASGQNNLALPREETVFGTPLSELTKQERWKWEENPLDIWDKLLAHADQDRFPDEADTFRFRYHGLFYVAPAEKAFMLRCRIPAGDLSAAQLSGLADIADLWGGGWADITTRANIQIRRIAPRDTIKVLTRLQELGLTARGSGVDNVRNITASPTAGIDPAELIDTRPLAKALHHYLLNHRDLYGLPRKFNVAFDGGGSVSVAADTNDIGFIAVRVPAQAKGDPVAVSNPALRASLSPPGAPGSTPPPVAGSGAEPGANRDEPAVEPGVYFRCHLGGVTGHKQFAQDAGILVKPSECVAVGAAMIRVFNEHGDRTDRKKARLKYLLDKWGLERFLTETQQRLAFPLVRFPLGQCLAPHPPLRHGHLGIYKQAQKGRNYIGVAVPVGRMFTRQMRRVAEIAQNYGSGTVRLTPWQNLLIPDVPDGFVGTVTRNLARIGFPHSASALAGGLVACTGNSGCKWAATNTKTQAVELARYLEKRVRLDQPINIHLTGCPNSCAQHYVGDIGLLGTRVTLSGESVEAYTVTFGGGSGHEQALGKEVFKGIPFSELPKLLETVLSIYLARRTRGESFAEFTRRHEVKELQEMFST